MNNKKTIIIAEAGINHNGSLNQAKELIDVASESGADYVKFQTFNTEDLVTKHAKKAEYQIKNTEGFENQFKMLKKLELKKKDHFELIEYCKKSNIKFLSTAFDFRSIDFLSELNLDFYKVPSGEITNLPYLRKIAKISKPVILSTGMSTLKEVKNAIYSMIDKGLNKEDLTVLHCNSDYPTSPRDVNLRAMTTIENEFNVKVGYSDHTLGIEIPIAAVALGAYIIEKHFTLDRSLPGPDQSASLEPDELKSMVLGIRKIEKSLGNGKKIPSKSEMKNIVSVRKSIVAKDHIKKGDIFTEKNLQTKRPSSGLSPMDWDSIIGKKAKKDFRVNDFIKL